MRTNEERQQLIHRRTLEIQREQQKKRERVISGSGIAACLMIIIGIGCLMPEVTKQASVSGAKTNYTTGMASMLGNYEALGYICMGILAFALGVCVTILLYRLRKAEEHRKKAEEYKQSQQVRENRLKKEPVSRLLKVNEANNMLAICSKNSCFRFMMRPVKSV